MKSHFALLAPIVAVIVLLGTLPETAAGLPANFTGRYEILQSRLLGLTNGGGYALQDGKVIARAALSLTSPFCQAGQSTFDEYKGQIDVVFQTAAGGSEHAYLTTIPNKSGARPTTIECVAPTGFIGALDLSIAFGRIVDLRQ